MGAGPHTPKARPDSIHRAGEPTAAAPTWQENILQKVVMTAFADRTVVTIAVRDPLVGCRGTPRERAILSSGQSLRSLGPGNQERTLELGRVRSLEGVQGVWMAGFRVGGFAPACPSDFPLILQVPGPPLSPGPVS